MTKSYQVAGHVFNLCLPDDFPFWDGLDAYRPFEVPLDAAPAFTLEITEEPVESEGMEKMFDAPTEDGETVIKLYRGAQTWVFEMSPDARVRTVARLAANADFSRGKLYFCAHSRRAELFSVNNALMLLFAFRTAGMGTLEMHASVIMNGGRAFLFLAKSGTGKSTHSQLWLKNVPGSELLNDDNPIVRVHPEDGSVKVYGSPWSGKTPCYKNLVADAGAFVQIRRCPENKISKLSLFESYVLLYTSSSGLKTDSAMADGLHATMESIAVNCPCYVLDCRPDDEAAMVCSQAVL
ncbi:MAG: hypothetical protein IJS62_04280 [Bacteroidales bacterium]|nr:hypothetical protein [Bacteroidales bacterium]